MVIKYIKIFHSKTLQNLPKLGFRGELQWLSIKVANNEKINEIERTRVRSPPRATSFLNGIFVVKTSHLATLSATPISFVATFLKL
jgi:hypothetical protein